MRSVAQIDSRWRRIHILKEARINFNIFLGGGGFPNKNEVDGPNRIPFKREPPFERCPDPFLHRFHVECS